jgi:DnaK suppressor protein
MCCGGSRWRPCAPNRPNGLEWVIVDTLETRAGSTGMDTAPYKAMLLRKRGEILAEGGTNMITASMDTNTRQGDLADQATGNNEVHIQLKLKQTDAKILQAIEEALRRIEKGTYGICKDCGEPIAEARLNAIPWTRSCIICKAKQSA